MISSYKKNIRELLAGKMEGSTGRQRLGKTIVENCLIPFLWYKEQLEIANHFIVFDRKIQHHQTNKQTLTVLFRSMLHQLMTGQIRVKDLEFSTVSGKGGPHE